VKLRVGTRRSPLARLQTNMVCDLLRAAVPGLEVELFTMETSGDRIRDRPLRESGGKGLFVKELDEALLAGRIDCAVHSLKDVPSVLPDGVVLAAVPVRADARDALVTIGGHRLEDLADDARIGTSSPRRAAQLLAVRPRLRLDVLRGNIETRLRRILTGDFDATLLAMAGLQRLAIALRPAAAVPLDPVAFVPAAGQGALGFTARSEDERTLQVLSVIQDAASRDAVDAERAVARGLGGSCWVPVAAYARVEGESLHVIGVVASADGSRVVRRSASGERRHATEIGTGVADAILAGGGGDLVKALPGAL